MGGYFLAVGIVSLAAGYLVGSCGLLVAGAFSAAVGLQWLFGILDADD